MTLLKVLPYAQSRKRGYEGMHTDMLMLGFDCLLRVCSCHNAVETILIREMVYYVCEEVQFVWLPRKSTEEYFCRDLEP